MRHALATVSDLHDKRRNKMRDPQVTPVGAARRSAICRLFPAAIPFCLALLTGCSQYRGIPRSQFIPNQPAQAWAIDLSPAQVWPRIEQLVRLEIGSEIVTKNDRSRLISWLSPEQTSRDLFCDAAVVRNSVSPVATPMTTAWLESEANVTNRCCLHLKRVYISKEACSGVGPSRGDYEALFVSALQSQMPGIEIRPNF